MLWVPCRLLPVPLAATRPRHNLVQAPVPARVNAGQPSPGLAVSSCRLRGWRVSAPKLLLLHFACTSTTAARCLTPRSNGAPTAGHQARSGGTRYIFTSPRLASCRRRPLSSNVRQRRVRKGGMPPKGSAKWPGPHSLVVECGGFLAISSQSLQQHLGRAKTSPKRQCLPA